MKQKIFLIFLLFLFKAECTEDVQIVDSSYKAETLSIYEKADQRWEEFQKEVSWFLSDLKSKLPLNDQKDELEQELHDKWEHEAEELKEALLEAQDKFMGLREGLATLFILNGTGAYADCSSATAVLDLTNWYTDYLEKKFFPPGWKASYEESKNKKDAVEKAKE